MILFDALGELANALVLENVRKDGVKTLYDVRNASNGTIQFNQTGTHVLAPGEVYAGRIVTMAWEETEVPVNLQFSPVPQDPRLTTDLSFGISLGPVLHYGAVGITSQQPRTLATDPYVIEHEVVIESTHEIVLSDSAYLRCRQSAGSGWSLTAPESIAGSTVSPDSPLRFIFRFEEVMETSYSSSYSISFYSGNGEVTQPSTWYGLPITKAPTPPTPPSN